MRRKRNLAIACLAMAAMVAAPDARWAGIQQRGPAGTITQSPELSRRIDALYARYDKPHTPGGVAAVIYRGEVLHLKGYGSANREFDVRWTPDTRYRIASITKSFVAHALLLLEERGSLTLGDPIQTYLPDFPTFDSPLTVHDLVTMTSGLWQDETLLSLAGLRGRVTLDDMYTLSKRQTHLNYQPGSAATYIDTNFRLLARIIARVSGTSFWQALDDLIFDPLGMDATLAAPDFQRSRKGQAPTYVADHGDVPPLVLGLPIPSSGDGSIITTMRDMVKWLKHLHASYQEDWSVFQRMTEPFVLGDGTPAYYRRGIRARVHRGLIGWGHGGFTGTYYVFWPDIDLIVANFTNYLGEISAANMSLRITDAFLEVEPSVGPVTGRQSTAEATPRTTPLSAQDTDMLSGTFVEPERGYVLRSRRRGDRLVHNFLGRVTRLERESAGHYRSPAFLWQLRLEVRLADCAGCDQPDLLVGNADWPEARRFVRVAPSDASGFRAEEYVGHYYSQALGVHYTVERGNGDLTLRVGAGVQASQILHLQPLLRDVFAARSRDPEFFDLFGLGVLSIKFARDPAGQVAGMRISTDRVRDLVFVRVH